MIHISADGACPAGSAHLLQCGADRSRRQVLGDEIGQLEALRSATGRQPPRWILSMARRVWKNGRPTRSYPFTPTRMSATTKGSALALRHLTSDSGDSGLTSDRLGDSTSAPADAADGRRRFDTGRTDRCAFRLPQRIGTVREQPCAPPGPRAGAHRLRLAVHRECMSEGLPS